MFGNIAHALGQIKSDVARALEPGLIVRVCRELGHTWRNRQLDPVSTVQAFLLQVLHGNTACTHVPHLLGKSVTGEAYGMARARLPLELFERLLGEVCNSLRGCLDESARWFGHRVWTVDGSSCSMPDTPELQAAFGQPGQQAPDCGFPVTHLLTLFHASTASWASRAARSQAPAEGVRPDEQATTRAAQSLDSQTTNRLTSGHSLPSPLVIL